MGDTPVIKSGRKEGQNWPDSVKVRLIQEWLRTGNLTKACKLCRVPYMTALDWKKTEWWKDLSERYRDELDLRLSSKIDVIVEKAVEEIYERVQNGEHILDSKTGDVIRIPPKSRDLAAISKFLTDRQDILIKRKKVESNNTETVKDKLDRIANQFASFVKQTNVKPPDVIEGELVTEDKTDAIYDQWEEGLQEGELEVQLETLGEEEESGT